MDTSIEAIEAAGAGEVTLPSVTENAHYRKMTIKCLLPDMHPLCPIQCRMMSSDPLNNEGCRDMECPSLWRACRGCIKEDTVGLQDDLIDKSTGYCPKHAHLNVEQEGLRKHNGMTPPDTLDEIEEFPDEPDEPTCNLAELESAEVTEAAKAIAMMRPKTDGATYKGRKRGRKAGNKKKTFDELAETLQEILRTKTDEFDMSVNQLQRFMSQPRENFDLGGLLRMGESLRIGQIYPIYVRRLWKDEKPSRPGVEYEIVDGERRWRGARSANLATVRVVALDIPNVEIQFVISAMANFGREGHTPIEEANCLARLLDEQGLSMEEASKMFSMSTTNAWKRLELLSLDQSLHHYLTPQEQGKRAKLSIAAALHIGKLLEGHADLQRKAVEAVVKRQLSVPQMEKLVESIMVEAKLVIPERKPKLHGPVKFRQRVEALTRNARRGLDGILALPSETFAVNDYSAIDQKRLAEEVDYIANSYAKLKKRIAEKG